jgi:glycosyltransferase involved in cell wall biosynthesis
MQKPWLSVVIPVYNEQGSIQAVYESVVETLSGLAKPWELIFIDDGSTDGGAGILNRIVDADERVRLIRFRRNFGQTSALRAGFDHARGEAIVSLDGDGQNDPADIPLLLAKLEEGFDVVNGWRRDRKDHFFRRILPSRLGNWLIKVLTGVNLRDFGCTLKAYRKEILDEISLYGEMHRMIPVLAHIMGATITEVPVRHHPRPSGRSKYTLARAISVILDLITLKFVLGYFTRPLHIFGLIALLFNLVGLCSFGAMIGMKVADNVDMTGNPFLILGVLCVIVGMQMVMMGLLGEVTIRTYFESQNKSTYVIKEIREKVS